MNLNKSFLLVLLFLFSLGSCVKKDNVDFTQADNISLHQQFSGSLISLSTSLSDFGDLNNLPFSGFDFNKTIDVFDNPVVQSELVKVTFHFGFDNTFDRDFGFTFNFLDVNDVIVYSTTINVNKKATTNQDVLVEGLDVVQIKKSTKVAISVVVLNSTPINTVDNTVGAFVNFTLGARFDLSSGSQTDVTLINFNASLPDLAQLDNLPFIPFEFYTPLDIFSVKELKKRLKKTEFHFEIENTFNRDFEVLFEFSGLGSQVVYSVPIVLNKTSKTIHDVLVEGADLDQLKSATKLKIKVNILNASTIDNTPGAFINIKSSVTLSF